MWEANKAISRVRHTIPTIEELRRKLNGAIYFSKIDLTKACHQLKLHPKSRDITTCTTHVRLRKNTVLNYGTCSAWEIFHEEIQKKVDYITGVINIYDDL